MKVNKSILNDVVRDVGIRASNCVGLYTFETPTSTVLSATQIEQIKNGGTIFNQLYAPEEHVRDNNPNYLTVETFPLLSIGTNNDILTQDGGGIFGGENVTLI